MKLPIAIPFYISLRMIFLFVIEVDILNISLNIKCVLQLLPPNEHVLSCLKIINISLTKIYAYFSNHGSFPRNSEKSIKKLGRPSVSWVLDPKQLFWLFRTITLLAITWPTKMSMPNLSSLDNSLCYLYKRCWLFWDRAQNMLLG